MPHYKKAFDIGTYTGNGGQYRVGIPTLRGQGASAGTVAQCLRFRASNSNYLTRTPASSGNRKTWTFSCWFKKTANGGNVGLFSVYGSSADTTAGGIVFGSSDQIYFMGWSSIWRRTTATFKDSSRWYHLVIAFDTTQATAANRVKMYIDGKQIDSFAASADPSLNTDYGFNTNNHHEFGAWIPTATSGYSYLDMYLAETYFLDGYAYDASYFGEFNSDGIWVPKAYTGSYGTNGFNLKFAPGAVGTDSSGNGNTWTLSGFNTTTANTTYDVMTDSPVDYLSGSMSTANNAGNYCTWSTAGTTLGSTGDLKDGNLYSSHNTNLAWSDVRGTTILPTSGKYYWEMYQNNQGGNYINEIYFGIMNQSVGAGATSAQTTNSGYYAYCFSLSNGYAWNNGTSSTYRNSVVYAATIGVAYDADNGKIWYSVDGTWQNSGNPATLANPAGSPAAGISYVPVLVYISSQGSYRHYTYTNFGQRPFTYTPPSGFGTLNTYKWTKPADSSLWFYGDTPDLMWIKNRSTTGYHIWTDTVRGVGLHLNSNTTGAENGGPAVTEMNKFGMTVLNEGTYLGNGSGNSHVYWAWKAGGSTLTTGTGTGGITNVSYSANPSTGFSIIRYTGSGTTGTITHGLGVKPAFLIIKNRTNGSTYAPAWHQSLSSSTYGLYFNYTNAEFESSSYFWNAAPTSSIINILTDGYVNTNGSNYIVYCWSAIPGYSAFGRWMGSGTSVGPAVFTGFRPKCIIWKRIDSTSNWFMYDAVRQTYNVMGLEVYPDAASAEAATTRMDFLSNGFQLRAANAGDNASSANYIYAAFAEVPFKFARAR